MGLTNNRLTTLHVKRDSRTFRAGNASSLEDLPKTLDLVEKPFVLLLAMDATRYSDEQIVAAAHAIALRGLVYLCAWGPNCERVHDLFDRGVRPVEESTDSPFQKLIMTTWHDEPLSEASWFLRFCAYPAEDSISNHFECIGVSVANHLWLKTIRQSFTKT